jgi:predicted dehydrogenase
MVREEILLMKALRIGLIDIVHAIEEGRPCRASGAMALHMLEVSEAILISAKENRYVQVNTTFERPEAMPQRD